MSDTDITRLEVIDQNGRWFVTYGLSEVNLSFQDYGHTLKIFCRSQRGDQETWRPSADIPAAAQLSNQERHDPRVLGLATELDRLRAVIRVNGLHWGCKDADIDRVLNNATNLWTES